MDTVVTKFPLEQLSSNNVIVLPVYTDATGNYLSLPASRRNFKELLNAFPKELTPSELRSYMDKFLTKLEAGTIKTLDYNRTVGNLVEPITVHIMLAVIGKPQSAAKNLLLMQTSLKTIASQAQSIHQKHWNMTTQKKTNAVWIMDPFLSDPAVDQSWSSWDDLEPELEVIFKPFPKQYVRPIVAIPPDSPFFYQKKGVLTLTGIQKLDKIDWDLQGKRLFIVRKPTTSSTSAVEKYRLKLVPSLSPSAYLFSRYYKWKEGKFDPKEIERIRQSGHSTQEKTAWWWLYLPEFLEEMRTREDLIKSMKHVIATLNEGVNITMVCFCPSESFCHRAIIGSVLKDRGYDVVFL